MSSGRKELRTAILGSGDMGSVYAESISKYNDRHKLVAISGGSRAPKLASDHGVDYVERYDDLLDRSDVDAVVIATPHRTHRDQVLKAAAKKKHVLVEKPMGLNTRECDDMITACKRAGVYLEAVQTLRYRGAFVRALNLIHENRIGKVRMVRGTSLFTEYVVDKNWAMTPENGGAMLDMGVHNFDIMKQFTGSDPTRVFSTMKTFGDYPLSDMSSMTQIVFANGAITHQWTCFEMPAPNLPDSWHRYAVVGEKGILDIDGYGKLQLGIGDSWSTIWTQPSIDWINRPFDPARLESFYTQTQAFADDILDARKPTVPGEDGRASVEMVEAAKISSRTGEVVKLPL